MKGLIGATRDDLEAGCKNSVTGSPTFEIHCTPETADKLVNIKLFEEAAATCSGDPIDSVELTIDRNCNKGTTADGVEFCYRTSPNRCMGEFVEYVHKNDPAAKLFVDEDISVI